MTLTTAYHRSMAKSYESQCDWERAAFHLSEAIKLYPDNGGELAKGDIGRLADRRDACLRMAERESADERD